MSRRIWMPIVFGILTATTSPAQTITPDSLLGMWELHDARTISRNGIERPASWFSPCYIGSCVDSHRLNFYIEDDSTRFRWAVTFPTPDTTITHEGGFERRERAIIFSLVGDNSNVLHIVFGYSLTDKLTIRTGGDLFRALFRYGHSPGYSLKFIYGRVEENTSAEPLELPESVHLAQNYPNPFNPSTVIVYTLDRAGPVELTVYDLAGRVVAVPVDGVQPAGNHETRFNADGLPTGMYLYRLRAGAETLTRTMTLVR